MTLLFLNLEPNRAEWSAFRLGRFNRMCQRLRYTR